MIKPPQELLDFLRRYDPDVKSIALGLRDVVLDELAPCHEYIFSMRSGVVLLYGTTERVMASGLCQIHVLMRHVNLAFLDGVDLADPQGLLKGTGKTMRHLTLKGEADLQRQEIRGFLRQMRKRAGHRRPRHRSADDVVTRVKVKPPERAPRWLDPLG